MFDALQGALSRALSKTRLEIYIIITRLEIQSTTLTPFYNCLILFYCSDTGGGVGAASSSDDLTGSFASDYGQHPN